MTAVVVTATLASNPALDPQWPLPLDGLCAYVAARRLLGRDFGSDIDPDIELDLPFERCEGGGDWWWAASCAIPINDRGEELHWRHSRTDLRSWERMTSPDARMVDEATARYKPVRLPAVTTVCSALVWRARATDVDMLAGMLAEVGWVGKRHGIGCGHVVRWSVREVEHPWGHWGERNNDGTAARPMPSMGRPSVIGACRPPYWHPARRCRVEAP